MTPDEMIRFRSLSAEQHRLEAENEELTRRASQLAAEANDALWAIMQECEGRRFHQSGYDITLDHIYDTAEAVRDLLVAGVVSSTQPEATK